MTTKEQEKLRRLNQHISRQGDNALTELPRRGENVITAEDGNKLYYTDEDIILLTALKQITGSEGVVLTLDNNDYASICFIAEQDESKVYIDVDFVTCIIGVKVVEPTEFTQVVVHGLSLVAFMTQEFEIMSRQLPETSEEVTEK